jgi:predicted Zn-ribbon and HTH transcriptional regulator
MKDIRKLSKKELFKLKSDIDERLKSITEQEKRKAIEEEIDSAILLYNDINSVDKCKKKVFELMEQHAQSKVLEALEPFAKLLKEEVIELMIQASKWGSWAYDLKERDRQGKTSLQDFKEWRKEVMDDLYRDKELNQNKDESN